MSSWATVQKIKGSITIHTILVIVSFLAAVGPQASRSQAIGADTGETRWTYEQRAGTMSLVATGGGLVFGGDTNGYFRAFDQASGEVLWEVNIGSEVTGYPVTYAVDGKQYVAVSTGTSSLTGRLTDLTPELNPGTANNLFVFALPN